jgi:hypothetical protein
MHFRIQSTAGRELQRFRGMGKAPRRSPQDLSLIGALPISSTTFNRSTSGEVASLSSSLDGIDTHTVDHLNRYASGEALGLSSRRDEFDPHTIHHFMPS